MARLSLIVIAVVAAAASAAAWSNADHNKFIVTFGVPNPFHQTAFFDMPRTLEAAWQDGWEINQHRPQDDTYVYCRNKDYRVCVLFDSQGSVAGIRASVAQSEMEKLGFDLRYIPEWELNFDPVASGYVYSATVFFVEKELLTSSGRRLAADDQTAPNGIYILRTNSAGQEVDRLHVPSQQALAPSAGFTEQACFFGMGKHYFQEMRTDSHCNAHRPFFTLYGPRTQQLNGFGFVQYGKISKQPNGRGWFESPTASVAKTIAPNSPACLETWVNTYGLFTLHVYFVSNPFFTFC